MADPSDLQRFLAYAQAFEIAFASDAWDGIAPFFADGARHVVHGAAPSAGSSAPHTPSSPARPLPVRWRVRRPEWWSG